VLQRDVIIRSSAGYALATTTSTIFARGNGGFGGERGPASVKVISEGRTPYAICDLPTLPQSALIYRLSGDSNPLHFDPDVAERAGFPRPILHGLASHLRHGRARDPATRCDYDPWRLTGMRARFSAPVFPGETIRTEM